MASSKSSLTYLSVAWSKLFLPTEVESEHNKANGSWASWQYFKVTFSLSASLGNVNFCLAKGFLMQNWLKQMAFWHPTFVCKNSFLTVALTLFFFSSSSFYFRSSDWFIGSTRLSFLIMIGTPYSSLYVWLRLWLKLLTKFRHSEKFLFNFSYPSFIWLSASFWFWDSWLWGISSISIFLSFSELFMS